MDSTDVDNNRWVCFKSCYLRNDLFLYAPPTSTRSFHRVLFRPCFRGCYSDSKAKVRVDRNLFHLSFVPPYSFSLFVFSTRVALSGSVLSRSKWILPRAWPDVKRARSKAVTNTPRHPCASCLFLCLTRRGSPPPALPSRSFRTLCQSSLSPLPFVRAILSPTRRGAQGHRVCTPTHRRSGGGGGSGDDGGGEVQGRKRSRGLSGRSVRERVRVLRGASVDTATPTSPRWFKYKRPTLSSAPPPSSSSSPAPFLSGTPRVPDAGHAPVRFFTEEVRIAAVAVAAARAPFLQAERIMSATRARARARYRNNHRLLPPSLPTLPYRV